MNRFLIICALILAPLTATAQTQEEVDKGYLVALIEGSLSGASREVSILGFRGALSSAASLDVLTIADADGVWLTLEDVVLTWNRSALLVGRIDVEEISAQRVIVARAPVSEATAPSPEAIPFALPELPVGIHLGTLNIAEIVLGETFLGEEVSFTVGGSASLSGGEGNAVLTATRLGDRAGEFAIDGAYGNLSRILALDLQIVEDAGGIAAGLLNLPGRPSTDLSIVGTAPIDDYAAQLRLATDGQVRVLGSFALRSDDQGQIVDLDIGGDVSPLFAPEYQSFFGDDLRLVVAARTDTAGEVNLEDLSLSSQALQLAGTAQIGSKGWPKRLNLTGQIASEEGVVLLPISGPKTYIKDTRFSLKFDEQVDPVWALDLDVTGFERPGIAIADLGMSGGGTLIGGNGPMVGIFTGDLNYAADGLTLDDAGFSQAFGDTIDGVLQFVRTEDMPTVINAFTLSGPGIEVVADATLEGTGARLRSQSNIALSVEKLERFSILAGRDLAGSSDVTITSTITPIDGLYDVAVTGTTQDLLVGIPQADAVLSGLGTIDAKAVRDTAGTRLESLRIQTGAAVVTGSADLTSEGSDAAFDVSVAEVAMIEPRLSGPISIKGTALQNADGLTVLDLTGTAKDTNFVFNADVNATPSGQIINFKTTAEVVDLRNYSQIAGRNLGGAANVDATGVVFGDGTRFVADVTAQTRDLMTDIAQLDPLLRGDGTLQAQLSRTGQDAYRLENLVLSSDTVDISGSGFGGVNGEASASIIAEIADATVIDPDLVGAITASIEAERDADNQAQVAIRLNGPGTDVVLRGDVSPENEFDGTLNADIANLADYRSFIDQPVSGRVSARAAGRVMADLSAFDGTLNVQSQGLGVGNPIADILLAGQGRLNAAASLNDGSLTVDQLEISTANLTVSGRLDGRGGAGNGAFDARLRDVGLLTDQLSGPVTATGTTSLDGAGNWGINANASGPGGIVVTAAGQLGNSGNLNLDVAGSAPLGLANTILEPRRFSGDALFDLSVNGPPTVNAVSGRIDLQNARLTAPSLAQGLTNIAGGVTLSNGTAQVAVTGDVISGGSVSARGPVTLATPQTADLTVALNNVIIKDPELYQTSIDGAITVNGPLTGGAQIAGQLNLGQTDVQVPSSGVGALGDLPNVTHIGASNAVRQTLSRAGATTKSDDGSTSTSRPFPLEITINAPSRIFIRGRGLDAELGGALRIGGTTDNVQPTGLFELVRGRIDILQQRFELTEGSASLQGDFEPYIKLVARIEARTGTLISITVEGPATEPEVTFTSTPQLPQDEVLAQLIFGRDLQNISPLQAVQLAAAVGTLAGRGGGGLIDNFRQNIGLDDFDVTTDADGNAAVRAGKYLSENIYTDVTVSSDGSTEVNLNLDITDDITAKGTVDVDGETSIGIFFEKDY